MAAVVGGVYPSMAGAAGLRSDEVRAVADLVPEAYRQRVLRTLSAASGNAGELAEAIRVSAGPRREGMAFLVAFMPRADARTLKASYLVENADLADEVMAQVPWGKDVPADIFLNDVLPYVNVNEQRDKWRRDFHDRFIKVARERGDIDHAVLALNKYVFDVLQVSYDPQKRKKPDQSPYESIEGHYASCTGLSVLLADALRSVGIPARLAGVMEWPDGGNHTWVEIWDGRWRAIGAAEPTELDHAWFMEKTRKVDARHLIYAVSFRETGAFFPMAWARRLRTVPGVNVTGDYRVPVAAGESSR